MHSNIQHRISAFIECNRTVVSSLQYFSISNKITYSEPLVLSIVLSKHFLFLIGILLILLAYFFQEKNWMKSKGFLYNFTNILGAGLLTYIAFRPFELEYFTIAIVWTLISIIRLFKSFKQLKASFFVKQFVPILSAQSKNFLTRTSSWRKPGSRVKCCFSE